MNSNECIVKGRIDSSLNDAFKKILEKLSISQQEFIDNAVKEFVLNNLNILFDEGNKK